MNQLKRPNFDSAFLVRLQFQKRSVLKLVSRTIPRKRGNDTHW